jgi:quinoprotein glucose dehydrogenase
VSAITPPPRAPWIYASVLFIFGLALAAGGAQLALLGGSLYYVLTGVILIASAVYLWRRRRIGMWLYLFVVAYTLIWSLWEIGLDGWALASRLGLLVVLALYFLFPAVRRRLV